MSNELNVFATNKPAMGNAQTAATAMMISRQAQEVQAAMIVAKRFPRNTAESANRILTACARPTLAENAMYSFPRGGSEVTGPSIRLAEAMAQAWGNIDFGFIELENKGGESQVMAYAWDLETNTRQSKVFSVPHVRHTNKGDYPLTDPRDIYEMVANQASRRVRSCILSIIPGDVVDMAIKACNATLQTNKEPLNERIDKMVSMFGELGVTADMLSSFIGKNVAAFTVQDVVRLSKIYRSIKDGVVGSDYFTEKMKAPAAEQPRIEQPARVVPAPAPTEEEQLSLDEL